ncbi:MAG TPA: HAD-IA family hydrolase [Bryobacteraceae bacterium]|nr:HAD-IA family hydrolase [Bryobacteraceae bacterium]
MPEPAIKALFTDVGGVLLTNGWDSGCRKAAARRFHLDLAEMESRHHLTFDTFEIGKVTLDTYIDRTVFYEPRPFTREEFRRFVFDCSQPYPEMLELMRRIRQRRRVKIAVVSNEGRELNQHRVRAFGLADFVDFFATSCYLQVRKPDLAIFQMALDLAQVSPEETVYIDDRPLLAEVAGSMGFRTIHHTSYEKTAAALGELGLASG